MDESSRKMGAAWREVARRFPDLFRAGVHANAAPRPAPPRHPCDGCGKPMTPGELAGVTEYGALCRECYEGTNDGR